MGVLLVCSLLTPLLSTALRLPEASEDSLQLAVDLATHEVLNAPGSRTAPVSLLEEQQFPFFGHHQKKHLWLFGAHHKTGTILLNRLALILGHALEKPTCSINGIQGSCGNFGPSCWQTKTVKIWFDCHVSARSLERVRQVADGTMRAVHIIRDPIGLVISGYVYHLFNRDGGRMELLQRLNLTQGVLSEAQAALEGPLPEMLEAVGEGAKAGDVLVVRLEDFMNSSASFDAAAERVFNYAVGDMVDQSTIRSLVKSAGSEDLARHPYSGHSTGLTNGDLKKQATAALQSIPESMMDRLKKYRKALGYA